MILYSYYTKQALPNFTFNQELREKNTAMITAKLNSVLHRPLQKLMEPGGDVYMVECAQC